MPLVIPTCFDMGAQMKQSHAPDMVTDVSALGDIPVVSSVPKL